MEEACFSNIRTKLIEKISKAQNEISIAVAWFTNQDLFNAIIECLNKNIRIDIILIDDYINKNEYGLNFSYFIEKGGNLFFSTNVKIMHNKFCIIDNQIVITGSYNWTYYAENKNWENILITKNSAIINQYRVEFDKIKTTLQKVEQYKPYTFCNIESDIFSNNYNYLIEDLSLKEKITGNNITEHISQLKNKIKIMESISISHKAATSSSNAPHEYPSQLKYSLGIRCRINNINDCVLRVLEKGTSVPCKNSVITSTVSDNQTLVRIEVLGGECLKANSNISFGWLDITDLPSLKAGLAKIETTISVDKNGRIDVIAKNIEKGSSYKDTYYAKDLVI